MAVKTNNTLLGKPLDCKIFTITVGSTSADSRKQTNMFTPRGKSRR